MSLNRPHRKRVKHDHQMVQAEDPLGDVTTYTYTAELQRLAKETPTETLKFVWEATEARRAVARRKGRGR